MERSILSSLTSDAALGLPIWLGRRAAMPLALYDTNDIWRAKYTQNQTISPFTSSQFSSSNKMGFFALEEWAAANRDYDNTTAPYWHAKSVPDGFTAISGILWSISYILMAKKAFKDRSYAMPLHCLCLNITWEAVYGFVYGPGLLNQVVFAQWMIVDVVLFYAILRSAPYAWKQSPLVARHLAAIIVVGCVVCLWLHLAIAATFIPSIGRQVVFMTAWPMQVLINLSSIAQLISRGNTLGHSWGIW